MPHQDDKVSISINAQVKEFHSAWVSFGELHNTYMEIPPNLDYLVVIRFKEYAFFELFGMSPEAFANKPIFNLHDFVNHSVVDEILKSYALEDPQERVRFLTTYLSGIELKDSYPKLLKDIVDIIGKQDKPLSVSDLSTIFKLPINEKWIQRSFKKYIGISPKKYLKMHRFIKVHDQLEKYNSDSKLAIALDHGYYDDNHFIKDFKLITGFTPNSYLL